jgi:hypothetical protein
MLTVYTFYSLRLPYLDAPLSGYPLFVVLSRVPAYRSRLSEGQSGYGNSEVVIIDYTICHFPESLISFARAIRAVYDHTDTFKYK